jgi:hypothetical protein
MHHRGRGLGPSLLGHVHQVNPPVAADVAAPEIDLLAAARALLRPLVRVDHLNYFAGMWVSHGDCVDDCASLPRSLLSDHAGLWMVHSPLGGARLILAKKEPQFEVVQFLGQTVLALHCLGRSPHAHDHALDHDLVPALWKSDDLPVQGHWRELLTAENC